VKKIIGNLLKFVLVVIVVAFLGSESLNFFEFVFPEEQWYMAYTGFGLTIAALFVYLYLFLYDRGTKLQKTVALIMMLVGVLGELTTAGFGMQIEAWRKGGYMMTESDFNFMVLAVRLLMFAHAIAIIAYLAGDRIIEAFRDDDNDGIPNAFDRDYKADKPNRNPPSGG